MPAELLYATLLDSFSQHHHSSTAETAFLAAKDTNFPDLSWNAAVLLT